MLEKVIVLEYDVITKQMVEKEIEIDMPNPAIAEREKRVQEIKQRLAEIDTEAVRPLRAIVGGVGTEFDTTKLDALEAEAKALRIELIG